MSLVVQWLRIHLAMQGMDAGSIPGWGIKIPHATEQLLSPPTEPKSSRAVCWDWSPCATREDPMGHT